MKKFIASLIVSLLVYSSIIYSQQANWLSSWSMPDSGSIWITDSHVDNQNNVYTVGFNSGGAQSYSCVLNKFSSQGIHQFTKYFYVGGTSEKPAVTTDAAGNIYVFSDLYVNVLSPSGDSLLQFNHDSFNSRKIEVSHSGCIYIYSVSDDNDNNNFGPRIIKYNPQGLELWDYVPFPISIQNGESARLNDAFLDAAGNSVITGLIHRNGIHSIFAARIDSNGLLIWGNEFNLPGKTVMTANKVAVDANGITFVTGTCGLEYHTNSYDAITVAYAPDGSLLWSKTFDFDSDYDEAFDIKPFGGGVVISGISKSSDTSPLFSVYYSTTGAEIWNYVNAGQKWIEAHSFNNFPPNTTSMNIFGDEIVISGTMKPSNYPTYFSSLRLNNLGDLIGRVDFEGEYVGRHQNAIRVNDNILLVLNDIGFTDLYSYIKLIQFDKNIITGILGKTSLPKEFALSQNYPNPFNPSTKIQYSLPSPSEGKGAGVRLVILKIYDVLGNEIATLVNEQKAPGNYEVVFDAGNLSSGIYFYKLKAGNQFLIRKMMVLK